MPLLNNKVVAPEIGIYHAATVCCPEWTAIRNFEYMAGKPIAWALVPNVWLNEHSDPPADPGIHFPQSAVNDVWFNTDEQCVPFIRISPRSRRIFRRQSEPRYSVEQIAAGTFDGDLRTWAEAARSFPGPLLVEFAAEMNGNWQPWNATYNGMDEATSETGPDGEPRYLGQKRYRDAHIHIVELCRTAGAENITWMFHVNATDNPKNTSWNRMEGYYPGDEYIDWIGVSCYAAHELGPLTPLTEIIDPAIQQIRRFSPGVVSGTKPIAIAELGAIDYPAEQNQLSKVEWIRDAYQMLAGGSNNFGPYRDQIKAVSWWDETWWSGKTNHSEAFLANNSIASSPQSVNEYRAAIANPVFVPLR